LEKKCYNTSMSKNKKRRENGGEEHRISAETARGAGAIALLALAVFGGLAGVGKAGAAGKAFFDFFAALFGGGYFLVPLAFGGLAFSFFRSIFHWSRLPWFKTASVITLFACLLGLLALFVPAQGGKLGLFIAHNTLKAFGGLASALILGALAAICGLVIFETRFPPVWLAAIARVITKMLRPPLPQTSIDNTEPQDMEETGAPETAEETPEDTPIPIAEEEPTQKRIRQRFGSYEPPPLSLLELDQNKPDVGDIKANATIIKRTLRNFGVDVEMDEVSIGPAVTRYALKPAEGVKLTAIVARQGDLALALAAHSLRIEAPIPGKSLVGIEIPNTTRATVRLGTLIENADFSSSDKHLLFALGKSVAGKHHFANLARMPHLLVAGATGSGKSVTIHALIASLIYRNSPELVRFIFIDPKRVELTLWSGIPHLATPVITDAKKAIIALRWATKEMDRRYDLLEQESVRDIESYHTNVKNQEPLPYLVVIIDELADLMSLYPRELEAVVVRLAQMSRAVGIHLILSTQRPSVNVITGLIKANIPSRIALQVVSQIDSRTILDTAGAEKLLGQGDMLFLSGDRAKPERIQSAFISEHEVKKIARHLRTAYPDEAGTELPPHEQKDGTHHERETDENNDEIDDALYQSAKDEVERAGKASTSYLQRKLRIGYARAARLMDLLEERGIIGPADGAKPREVRNPSAPRDTELATTPPTTETPTPFL
jgi:S-DNA-T family DNA segregation ATPase FtsK/SpoIIIE